MNPVGPARARLTLQEALRSAYATRLAPPASLEEPARRYARALRLSGVSIESALVDVKTLVREETGDHEMLYIPRVVGWAVAGYFARITGSFDTIP